MLDDGSGFDVTEAGTKKRLAMYVVRDPARRARHRPPRPRPADRRLHPRALRARSSPREGRKQIKGVLRDQGTIAGIGNAYSDEILHAARMSPFKPAATLVDDDESPSCYDAIRDTLGDAVERSRGLAASELKAREEVATSPCTAAPASRARCAATPSARCPSPTRACSTAPPARPAASRSPTGG